MYIFWHRFIFNMEQNKLKRIWCRICILYRIIGQFSYNTFNLLRHQMNISEYHAFIAGVKEGKLWTNSKEYNNLPPIIAVK